MSDGEKIANKVVEEILGFLDHVNALAAQALGRNNKLTDFLDGTGHECDKMLARIRAILTESKPVIKSFDPGLRDDVYYKRKQQITLSLEKIEKEHGTDSLIDHASERITELERLDWDKTASELNKALQTEWTVEELSKLPIAEDGTTLGEFLLPMRIQSLCNHLNGRVLK